MKDVIGPHVLEKTPRTKRINGVDGKWRKSRVWECKYCDWSGEHPKKGDVHIRIMHDCEEVEWLGSELEKFKQEYR